MTQKSESKRELLRDKVIDLVKEFIEIEGEISLYDLNILFGQHSLGVNVNEVATALAHLPIIFTIAGRNLSNT